MATLRKLAPCLIPVLAAVSCAPSHARSERADGSDSNSGLSFRIYPGVEWTVFETPPVTQGTRLSPEASKEVLDRLPALPPSAEDRKTFALRETSLPPPQTGKTVDEPFPPPQARPPPASEAGPLAVLRHMPDGDVTLAPHLSITFSQPMVNVASYQEASRIRPARLTPEPRGAWRWIGTKTALFEPAPPSSASPSGARRFPMSTEFRVEVPAGTRSATGATLARALSWTFTTPTVKAVTTWPEKGPVGPEPVMFVSFDQRIDPQAVLGTIQVVAADRKLPLRLATAQETKADENVRRMAERAEPGRSLAFRAVGELPNGALVKVSIGPGTPSTEGPLRTKEVQEFRFHTGGPLKVEAQDCTARSPCTPRRPFAIRMFNPIDRKRFDRRMVTVEPALPDLTVEAHGQELVLHGRTRANAEYKVTLAATLPDEFGQRLGKPVTVTVHFGKAEKELHGPREPLVVLDPASHGSVSVFSAGHDKLRVRLFAVKPDDWRAYRKFLRRRYERNIDWGDPPGRRVLDVILPVKGPRDDLVESLIGLAPALTGGQGNVILRVEPPVRSRDRFASIVTWVQVTTLGVDAYSDAGKIAVLVTDLSTGKPREAEVELAPGGATARTDASGLAVIPLPRSRSNRIVVRAGKDAAFLPSAWTSWQLWDDGEDWVRSPRLGQRTLWYVADDRHVYRPGEEVKLKGWLRRIDDDEDGDLLAIGGASRAVTWALRDPEDNALGKGSARLGALGGFDITIRLPKTMNLGSARLELLAAGDEHTHWFEVQEFRRPEFEVSAQAQESTHFIGGSATVTVNARYFTGAGLPSAEAKWEVFASPAHFEPPGHDGFAFGRDEEGFWGRHFYGGDDPSERYGPDDAPQTLELRTDANGKSVLGIDFLGASRPGPVTVDATATVMDVNRQAWSASARLLVHPADVYVGLRSARLFVGEGQPIRVEAIATDLEGRLVAGRPVTVRVARLSWGNRGDHDVEEGVGECRLTSTGREPVVCALPAKSGGLHRATAVVTDGKGRKSESQVMIFVAGGRVQPDRRVDTDRVRLVPDKAEYSAGDVAEIAVIPPWSPAQGVLTVRRSGLVKTERFAVTGDSYTARVEIEEAWTPGVMVQVDLVGSAPRTDDAGAPDPRLPPRPALASGEVTLRIPPARRRLKLEVTPRQSELEPGGETVLDVAVHDARGQPVAGADVAVVVVDEAILSLARYRMGDPLTVFYPRRPSHVEDRHLREAVMLAKPPALEAFGGLGIRGAGLLRESIMVAYGNGRGELSGAIGSPFGSDKDHLGRAERECEVLMTPPPQIAIRKDFDPLALFAPSVPTDVGGRAQVKLKVPDSVTRYRVMAIAAAGVRQFGHGETTVTARLPLMVRPSPPRFLNFGDVFELPVVLQNQTDRAMKVDVAVRTLNLKLTEGEGRRVTVAPRDRVEVRFPAAAVAAGTARFQVGAVAGSLADASHGELPVWTPATTEAFATYGTIDEGSVVQPVKMPDGVVTEYGGLEVTTSVTALHALADAMLYLVRYPYECSEQMASRILAVAALRDVLATFEAKGLPKPDAMIQSVKKDLENLRRLQNPDGGWAFWRRGDRSWPFLTLHVTHALARSRANGFDVPQESIDRAMPYLRGIEKRIPSWYQRDARQALIAYSVYVRDLLGDRDAAKAAWLVADAGGVEKLPLEAIGWIYPTLSKAGIAQAERTREIRRLLANRIEETASAAHFVTGYGDGGYLLMHSDRRVDGILLDALIVDQPRSDLVPKLVAGLLGHRTAGRWENTQESAWALLALDRYFHRYEKVTPELVARVWLGPRYAGDHAFRGRTTERSDVDVPMAALADSRTADLTVSKEGKGRLYYRIGMSYAPANLTLPAVDNGFTVERVYEAIDRPNDVRKLPDGSWRVRAGARIRVRLTIVAPSRRTHVALVDPLPAGLEPLSPALAVTGPLPPDRGEENASGRHRQWWARWYEHENLRDERVEAFSTFLWEGVYTYSYMARATTPGRFVVPPPKAEEMYHPETFGRGAGDRLVVE